jgi:uncharacterized protein (DUF58 family)
VSPSPRAALLVALAAALALVVPWPAAVLVAAAAVGVTVADAWLARGAPALRREAPAVMVRGVPAPFALRPDAPAGRRGLRLRQPVPPDLRLEPAEDDGALEGRLVARRRGRHVLPAAAVRREGPLGLGRWSGRAGEEGEILVHPDVPGARRLAVAVREGRFRDPGLLRRGPLGLGTDFETVRDAVPEDDVRHVNWRATARVGRPMANQYRVERDRDVLLLLDAGRLMRAPVGPATRLDLTVDAAVAVAAVADVVGDRCGALAFDDKPLRSVATTRGGSRAVIRALFDLEPTDRDSDYERAFRRVGDARRSVVLVLVDLLEEAAARPLLDAVPVLARRHVVLVASVADPELEDAARATPADARGAYRAAVAVDVLAGREQAVRALRRAGARVVEAPPEQLPAACVAAYLRAKDRARL